MDVAQLIALVKQLDLAQLLALIQDHRDIAYTVIIGYAGSNSLLMLLLVGYAAHLKAFDLATVIPLCWAASMAGDALRFWIARRWGRGLVAGRPRIAAAVAAVTRLIERHYLWMILIHRYPHGIRGVAAFAYGMASLTWPLFLVLNAIAAAIWATAVVMAGYSFGHLSEKALGEAASGLSFALLAAFLGLAWLLSKKLERAIERG
jgi:membrane protein DedA with SNARE-associated domain